MLCFHLVISDSIYRLHVSLNRRVHKCALLELVSVFCTNKKWVLHWVPKFVNNIIFYCFCSVSKTLLSQGMTTVAYYSCLFIVINTIKGSRGSNQPPVSTFFQIQWNTLCCKALVTCRVKTQTSPCNYVII